MTYEQIIASAKQDGTFQIIYRYNGMYSMLNDIAILFNGKELIILDCLEDTALCVAESFINGYCFGLGIPMSKKIMDSIKHRRSVKQFQQS